MNSKLLTLRKGLMILAGICCIHLGGCSSSSSSDVTVMIFSDLPLTAEDEISTYLANRTDVDKQQLKVNLFLPSAEKLMVELVAGEGDVYLVEESLLPILFDPVMLEPLQVSADLVDSVNHYTGFNDRSNEEHVYALATASDNQLFNHLGYSAETHAVAMMREQKLPDIAEAILDQLAQ